MSMHICNPQKLAFSILGRHGSPAEGLGPMSSSEDELSENGEEPWGFWDGYGDAQSEDESECESNSGSWSEGEGSDTEMERPLSPCSI